MSRNRKQRREYAVAFEKGRWDALDPRPDGMGLGNTDTERIGYAAGQTRGKAIRDSMISEAVTAAIERIKEHG